MNVPKLAQVWPIVKVESCEGMHRVAKDWEARAMHLEEYALTLELLLAAYKLQLTAAEKEIERIKRWSD